MGIDVCIIVEHRYLVNKVVHKDTAGKNRGICSSGTVPESNCVEELLYGFPQNEFP